MNAPSQALQQYQSHIGQQIGVSEWLVVDQDRIDSFGKITEDEQFIHMDPERAAQSPFGGTIAHGFLSLSLLSAMASSGIPLLQDADMAINYGFNRVRFLLPVRSGKRVRGVFVLKEVEELAPGQFQMLFSASVEVEAEEKPALIADWLIRMVM